MQQHTGQSAIRQPRLAPLFISILISFLHASQDPSCSALTPRLARQGFRSVYKPQRAGRVSFAELLDAVAAVSPELRVRFTSPHPKEFSDKVLQVSLLGVVGQLYEGSPAALALAVKLACALSCRTGAMCCSAPVEMARWCSTGPAYSAHARRLLREDVKQHALFLCLLLLI